MKPSLTRRLLLLYVATIVVVLGVASGLVWTMMRRALSAGLDEALRAEALALAGRLEADEGRVEFEQGVADTAAPEDAEALVQIVGPGRKQVFASPALGNSRTLIERIPSDVAESPFWFTTSLIAGDQPYRVLGLHAAVHSEDEPLISDAEGGAIGVWILVARPLAHVDRTLAQLAGVLAVSVGTSILAALVGGWIATRRGTRPVRALADSVGRVMPGDTELRLDSGRVPVELEPIVRTIENLLERVRGELARQRQLTADVAHDLRTPVAGVRTLLDVCLQRERAAPEYVTAIERARGALRQLSQLLDDVLTLSRLEAGADQPVWTRVPLEEVLSGAVATVQPLAAARGVTIETEACPSLEFRTDRGKVVKILSNLLSNAVEHSPPGRAVCLASRLEDGSLELAVTDQGPGIPPELRQRIFDRFVRGDEARSRADGHQGLGLPIAAGLARTLGGEVRLDERTHSGSRFVVTLPLKP